MLSSIGQDLRYAIRTFVRTPGFTIVAVTATALGIGANTAMFTIVNTVLLRPLPYPAPEQLMVLTERNLSLGFPRFSFSPANFLDYQARNHTFAGISALRRESMSYTGSGDPELVPSVAVSSVFFDVMRVAPAYGRGFSDQDANPGSARIVVISHGFWQKRFGGNKGVLNQNIRLDNEQRTIVGIMPPRFEFPPATQIWMPAQWDAEESGVRGGHYVGAIGRVKPGVTVQQATADLNSIAAQLQQQYKATNTGWDTTVTTLQEQAVGKIRPAILTLLAAVGFVLLIACANLANLLLSRSSVRRREMSVRGALGAGKGRLIRQLITESLALAIAGGVVGLSLGYFGIQAFLRSNPDVIPRSKDLGLDWHVLAFTLFATLVTGALFGLAPALHLARFDLNSGLREGGRGASVGFRRNKLRSVFVIAEIALSMVLLAGAGLLMKSFYTLTNVDPGFDATNLVTMRANLSDTSYHEPQKQVAFYSAVLAKVRALPGVQAAGATLTFPLAGGNNFLAFNLPTHPPKPVGQADSAAFYAITPGYLEAMRIPLKAGRYFTDNDREGSQKVAIVTERWAQRYMPGENALGKPIIIGGGNGPPAEIVGIVGDIHDAGLEADSRPAMYQPAFQTRWGTLVLAVRTAQSPTTIVKPVQSAIRDVDPEVPIDQIATAEDVVIKSLAQPRLAMVLMATFAALALVLATVGIYGVMSYTVAQATPEIGVRMALGAQSGDVLRLVLQYGGAVALAGLVIGVPVALGLSRLLSSQLFGIAPHDPATFASVAAVLAAVSMAACLVPAIRAMRVDPNVALRYE